MNNQDLSTNRATRRQLSRRDALRTGGLLAAAAGLAPLIAACGGSTATATPTSFKSVATVAAPTLVAPGPAVGTVAPAEALSSVLNIKAHELDKLMVFDVDRLAVTAGKVTFNFTPTGKMTHELFVYPLQDLSQYMALARAGKSPNEDDYIKNVVATTDEVAPGKSVTVDGALTPGFYELACFIQSQNADGTSFIHFDGAQSVTFAAVGPGGPAASVLTPSSTLSVVLEPGNELLKDSWLFTPDHLMVKSGPVTFNIANKMDMAHDFVVYPLGNVSSFIAHRLAGQEDYTEINGEVLAEDLAAGASTLKTKTLTAGWWTAACFVVSSNADGTKYMHRDKGQRFTFLVL